VLQQSAILEDFYCFFSNLPLIIKLNLNNHKSNTIYGKPVMPLEEKDMDKLLTSQTIDRKYINFLSKMERGKYYSQSEMGSLILGKPLAINESLDLKSSHFKVKLERFGDTIGDISFVNCAIEINHAVGKLKVAEKNNDLYYSII
jgi:hypothetical protein